MPRINDSEPIIVNGKKLYENELDRIKKMYGFADSYPININIDDRERAERYLARLKHKKNKAK